MPLDPPLVFPSVPDGEELVLSASTFVTFEQCPEQAAGRLRGVYGPESRASFVGGLAHRMFARHLTDGPISDDEWTTTCRQEIGSSMNPKLVSLGLKPSELTAVIEEVGKLYQRFTSIGTEGFEGAEVSLEVEPSDGVVLRGAIDAVFEDHGVRLVDWKTGAVREPANQLLFYALLWAWEKGEIPTRTEAVSVGTGERFEVAPSRQALDDLMTRVAHAVTELRRSFDTGESLARLAGPGCRWCPLLENCSEGSAAIALLGAATQAVVSAKPTNGSAAPPV